MCTCVFVSQRASRRLPTFCSVQSGCIEEPFGPHFLQRKCDPPPPPSPPFCLPLTCNAWLTTAPLKEVKGQTKQSGVMATCVPPTSMVRGKAGGPNELSVKPLRMLPCVLANVCTTYKHKHKHTHTHVMHLHYEKDPSNLHSSIMKPNPRVQCSQV